MCIALILPVNRINKPSIKSTPFRNCNQIILKNRSVAKGKTVAIQKKVPYDSDYNVLLYGLMMESFLRFIITLMEVTP